jgi:SMODS and SLOG-associating 2TM effector domain 1
MEETAMEPETPQRDPILELAWQNHADLNLAADKRTKGFYDMRKWIAWLGIVATLFAILTQEFFRDFDALHPPAKPPFEGYFLLGLGVKVLFIAIPIIASAFAAFATRFYSNGSWLIYRAGSEEVKKEIYIYRTVLPKDKSRRDYLEKRLGEIQRKVYRNLGGEYALEPYKGPLPASYKKDKPGSDPGFHDLDGDEYATYRLKHQLDWHNGKIIQRKRERLVMTIAILAAGGTGAMLAAWGGALAIGVALTASITAALLGWQELKKVDETIKNYSKVVLELNILYNHWKNLETSERTPQEFEKMVLGCERVLWTQNREYIRSMQEALREADLEKDAALINEIIKESADSAQRAKEKVHGNIIETTEEALAFTEQSADEASQQVLGALAAEASSEIVQQELAAMGEAITETAERALERASNFADSLAQVAQDFAHVDIGKDTDKEELNAILASYPKTNDVKG